MKMTLYDVALPLRHVFTIAHGSISLQENLIVELRDGDHAGYGEGASLNYYGVTAETMRRDLEALRGDIENTSWERPEELFDAIKPKLAHNRFALCALDQAAHDLWGNRLGKPVYELWGLKLDPERLPRSNYTIGIDPIEKMVAKMQEFGDWPIFKIKLGAPHDAEILRAMRAETNAALRVDANCGWTLDSARELLPLCVECGVEFVEQPFPAIEVAAMQEFKSWSPLPLVADESCVVEADVATCEEQFHGINIKLMKCGGLTPARRMIAAARKRGLKVMLGCMTESSIGISALAQLAPFADAVDMDGAVLLAKDLADGVRLERGKAHYPERGGTGVTILGEPGELGGREL